MECLGYNYAGLDPIYATDATMILLVDPLGNNM